jgi:hypothetical protein
MKKLINCKTCGYDFKDLNTEFHECSNCNLELTHDECKKLKGLCERCNEDIGKLRGPRPNCNPERE